MVRWFSLVCLLSCLSGCGYGDFQRHDAYVESKWADVLKQYQCRSDLVPHIVAVVKGQSNFEPSVLTRVIDARSLVLTAAATSSLLDHPQAFTQFQKAQTELSNALSQLFTIAQRYPHLKSDPTFESMHRTLLGVEQLIQASHHAYIHAAQGYNTLARSFPSNITGLFLGYKSKPHLHINHEASGPTMAAAALPG